MATFEDLARHFRRQVELPWRADLAPDYRVWILWYEHGLERRVRGRLPELKATVETAGHSWRHLDLAPEFGRWLAKHELFDDLMDIPEELPGLLPAFAEHLKGLVQAELNQCTSNELLAISGVGSLFRLASVSELIKQVVANIPGRLMLLFPGRHQAGVYRLLDAREGWNYRATPIPAADAPEG